MDLKQLRYFVCLAENLHFSKAAESLDITPSALSMQLQALEKELQVRLVARTKRSVSLTTAGRIFLQTAQETLACANNARRVATLASRGELGSIEIGYVFSSVCSGVVQSLLSSYRARYSQVYVTLNPLESPLQIQLLQNGKLDVCVVRTVAGYSDDFEQICVYREPMVAAMSVNHRLARDLTLRAADLAEEAFVVPQFETDIGFAKHLLAIGGHAGYLPRVETRTKDFITALTHVASGHGVAVIPRSVSVIGLPGLVFLDFVDVEEVSELFVVARKNDTSPFVKSFTEIARTMSNSIAE
ncbi:LysR family transcriptional regulator [Paraburkholderia sediminicola]|uniref:LysR family transcriptional regulator n=1 Tax=Paraburkholderia sediminicola TaxID=458836 RepID=UPI0038B838C2